MLRRAVASLAGVLAIARAIPAPAQQPQPEQGLIRVAAISPWVDAAHPFSVTVQITNTTELSLDRVSVHVSVFARVATRSQLREALDRRAPTPLLGGTTERVDGPIAPGEQRAATVVREARGLAGGLRRTGVYPIEISLRHAGGEVVARTAVPFLASTPQTRIGLAWILPVTRPTVRRADGVYPADTLDVLGLDELTQQMNVIGARQGARITLAANPSLLDTLADLADGFALRGPATVQAAGAESSPAQAAAAALAAVKRAAGSAADLATVPYAPVNLPTLARRGLRADLLRQITLGRSVTEGALGRAPSLSAFVPAGGSIDGPAADALAPLGISGFVVSQARLPAPSDARLRPDLFGPSRPVALRSKARDLPALLPDLPLSDRIDGPEQGVLLAQAIVAETASAWLELPAHANERVLGISSDGLPSPTALAAGLDALAAAPWVRMLTVVDAITSLPPQQPAVAPFRLNPPDRNFLAAARAARRAHTTFAGIVVDPLAELDVLDRMVLLSQSSEWNADPAPGVALARAVSVRVRRVLGAVRVVSRHVTLTSRRGDVPVTVLNGNEFPLAVRLRLESPKVAFPSGPTRRVELRPPNQTFAFPVEARAAGSFPLDVRIEMPDGRRVLVSGRIILRSTAFSAVALIAVGGGALFLLLAWAGRGARRRSSAASG